MIYSRFELCIENEYNFIKKTLMSSVYFIFSRNYNYNVYLFLSIIILNDLTDNVLKGNSSTVCFENYNYTDQTNELIVKI